MGPEEGKRTMEEIYRVSETMARAGAADMLGLAMRREELISSVYDYVAENVVSLLSRATGNDASSYKVDLSIDVNGEGLKIHSCTVRSFVGCEGAKSTFNKMLISPPRSKCSSRTDETFTPELMERVELLLARVAEEIS